VATGVESYSGTEGEKRMGIEAMKEALEVLETPLHAQPWGLKQNAVVALRTAIEQAEKQEPRQWVGLTDQEVEQIADSEYEEAFVRLVEAKLKEKNNG
jgi:hypothetical protein